MSELDEDNNSSCISQELTNEDAISELIQKILMGTGPIAKLERKSRRISNFNGCLFWSIPFHKNIDCESINNAFKKLKLEFNLYVFIGGVAKVDCEFFIEKQKTVA